MRTSHVCWHLPSLILCTDGLVRTPPRWPAENYGVDIGAPFRALLPVLAFEGATKRNRPQLQVRVGACLCAFTAA